VENNMTLVKFDMTAIPKGAQVSSASLNFYLYEIENSEWRSDGKIEIHRISPQNTWNESSVNWDERLSGTPWESHDEGKMYEEQYADEGYPKIIPSSETLGWKQFSIKDAMQAWIDGEENNGLVIFDSGLTQNLYFYSKDYEDETLRPYLEVTYVGSAPQNPFDRDGDGIEDKEDNCKEVANLDQTDNDIDEIGDACDPYVGKDYDDDAIGDNDDNCIFIANTDQQDSDNNGLGDTCDYETFGKTGGR
jgi:hypothetical protein